MKYLIVECFKSYAVALDQEGRFIKVANFNYEVGQTVKNIVAMKEAPNTQSKNKVISFVNKYYRPLIAVAAVIIIFFSGLFVLDNHKVGTVYMTINPQIEIGLNRKDKVLEVGAINQEAKILLEDYKYKNKNLDTVLDEILDLAEQNNYLDEKAKVTLKLDEQSLEENEAWYTATKDRINRYINSNKNRYYIVLENDPIYSESDYNTTSETSTKPDSNNTYQSQRYIVPVETPQPEVKPTQSKTNKRQSPVTTYDISDYSDYDDSDYEASSYDDLDYNETDYDDSDYHGSDDNSDYD
ncbi:MAG: hypothetical protein GX326_00590 [Clostridiaceae bacterium]|nr:hypothetical protein [Clostridiaceae bacterium]